MGFQQQGFQQPQQIKLASTGQQGSTASITLNTEKATQKAKVSIVTVDERQAGIDASKYSTWGFIGGFFLCMVGTLVLRWILNAFIQVDANKFVLVSPNGDGIWTTKK